MDLKTNRVLSFVRIDFDSTFAYVNGQKKKRKTTIRFILCTYDNLSPGHGENIRVKGNIPLACARLQRAKCGTLYRPSAIIVKRSPNCAELSRNRLCARTRRLVIFGLPARNDVNNSLRLFSGGKRETENKKEKKRRHVRLVRRLFDFVLPTRAKRRFATGSFFAVEPRPLRRPWYRSVTKVVWLSPVSYRGVRTPFSYTAPAVAAFQCRIVRRRRECGMSTRENSPRASSTTSYDKLKQATGNYNSNIVYCVCTSCCRKSGLYFIKIRFSF